MKKNSNSYQLIKSLTMSEKRYFKIFSERHTIGSQNKYVLLFDALDKADAEDDHVLKKELRSKGINVDFLSADKNYLYQLLLRSLNDFHTAKTYNISAKEILISIEILFHKGLYSECMKLIHRAEQIAEECENFHLMIDVLTWKKKCSGYSMGLKKASEVNLEIDKYIGLLNNLKRITDLYYESNLIQADHEKYSKAEVLKKLKLILSKPELKSEKNALSFSAKVFFNLIYSNYYYVTNDKDKEYNYLQRLINILNESKIYSIENPLDYVSIYNRLLSIKKFFPTSDFFDDIKKLNEFSKKTFIRKEIVSERIFVHTNTHELEYFLINNDFQSALIKLKTVEKGISDMKMEIEPYHMMYFYYLHIVTLICVGEFHKALKFINKTLNEFDKDARPQVYIRIEVLNIITHFELKNFTLVLSIAKHILRRNKMNEILNPIELSLILMLQKMASLGHFTMKEEFSFFSQFKEEIDAFKESNLSPSKGLVDNYEKWVWAKIKRKTVVELYSAN